MNRLTKIVIAAASSALIFATPAAYAAGNATSVVNSGDNTTVNTTTNQTSSVSVNNSNSAQVNQMVSASSNTGDNTANGNIGMDGVGTSILTGAAGVSANFAVDANTNTTVIGETNPASNNLTDVTNTGDDANVNTSTSTSTSIQVNNTNEASVNQSCGGYMLPILGGLEFMGGGGFGFGGCSANTGNNTANDNIGGAGITTGNAGVSVTMQDTLNKNQTVIGDPLGMEGLGSLMNGTSITNTGDDANVNTSSNSVSQVQVNNLNMALIEQMLFAHSNSGDNTASSNIGGTGIMTGAAGVSSSMNVDANTNATGIGDGFGMTPLMSNLNDFVNTGDDLSANTTTTSLSSALLNNSSSLYSSQFVHQHSESGDNTSNSNVGSTMLGTSGAGISVGMSSGGNTNTTVLGGLLNSLLSLLFM